MKIFMTGGTGFVGSHLCQELTRSGHEVTVLTRRAAKGGATAEGISYIEGDPRVPGAWQEQVAEHDAVINLAGKSIFSFWTAAARQEILDSRVLTTRNVVDALLASPAKQVTLLSTSAVGYYGTHLDDQILDEEAPAGDDFLAEVSLQWEAEARRAENQGVRLVIMRFGIVFGRNGGALASMLPAFRYCLASPFGSGKQWFSWIHEQDLAAIMLFVLSAPNITGPVNCTAPNPVRNKELTQILAKALHRPLFMPAVPGFLLKVTLGELGNVFLKGQRVIPRKLMERGFEFRYPHLREALQDLLR